MAPTNRPEGQLNLNLSSLSPIIEPTSSKSAKSPFGLPKSTNGGMSGLSGTRIGAGSPSHEQTSRLFPKRTRELQNPAGVSLNIWGPPTSGTSTPLFEIPESPSQDGFPDLVPLTETGINSPARRGRAGTLPSRISPVGAIGALPAHSLASKTSRPTPSTSPFRPSSTSAAEDAFNAASTSPSGKSTLLSRLRAGSMPQRANLFNPSGAIGQSPLSSAWGSRARAATLTSIHSAEDPSSPQQPGHAKDGLADGGVRTLDYLGLAESPYHLDAEGLRSSELDSLNPSNLASIHNDLNSRIANRFRSLSVNTQPKYDINSQDNNGGIVFPGSASGTLTPSAAAALEAEYEAVQERVRLHNQAVQAYALNANAARPRARTAGLVETPQRISLRKYGQISTLDLESPEVDQSALTMGADPNNLAESLYNLQVADNGDKYEGQDEVGSQISRSLWIGSIPNSTTVSSLDAIFAHYGSIESTRVLTHKNCGFVNFENTHDAVRARQVLNGKEIFPGAGPVRIGFAKAPNNSMSHTPGHNGQSPTFDAAHGNKPNANAGTDAPHRNSIGQQSEPTVNMTLADLKQDILKIVVDFGAQQSDIATTSDSIDSASNYQTLEREIPPISEPSSNRIFDAPRLRDIRKRIDNQTCGVQEIEQTAVEMLPEIAELSSDYLGNTVVQKLFEFCSESIKEEMLSQIAPHLAEIGVHKNGTWAAQKIIEVCKTDAQMKMIVHHLRPYTVPLFLDQYGNYVLQCCLKFGAPYNDFIFETMLSQLWEIAQGRFGARAMRACLESHHATKQQLRMMAAAIALHSIRLATNTNGALLLTWLLDTCTFPRRRTVLAPRLVPNLVQLCTHKVAYLTVLKVVNQKNEPEAKDLILKALFFDSNDSTLEQILSDQTSGVTLVFKIITNPFLDESARPEVIQNVSKILEKIKAQPNQGYKRLMDEVGLSSRPTQPAAAQYAGHSHANGERPKLTPITNGNQYANNFMGGMNTQAFDGGVSSVRSGSNDSFGYSYNMNSFPNQQQHGFNNVPYQQMAPQNQYHNYQRNSNGFMNNGFGGFTTTPSPMENFRGGMVNPASPLTFTAQMSPVMSTGSFPHQGYTQHNMPNNVYGYNASPTQNHGYYFSPPMQAIHSGGRGRRVR